MPRNALEHPGVENVTLLKRKILYFEVFLVGNPVRFLNTFFFAWGFCVLAHSLWNVSQAQEAVTRKDTIFISIDAHKSESLLITRSFMDKVESLQTTSLARATPHSRMTKAALCG